MRPYKVAILPRMLPTLPDILLHVVFTLVLLGLLQLSRSVYLAFRRRRAGYGIVFNSITGLPEPLVSVRLVTPGAYGQSMSTAVTDRHGRYRLPAHPGEYLVEVKKEGFVFPSKHLKERSTVYDNILPAARIQVRDHGVITKNIPVDPADISTASRIFHGDSFLDKRTKYILAYLSPVALVWIPLIRGSWVLWTLFGGYLVVILYRTFTFKPAPPAFGTVTNAQTKEPVTQAAVRVFSTEFNKLLETQVTGPRGRFAFVVHPGSYYLLIKKPGYRSVRMNFPAIKKDGFILARDVMLKPAPNAYVDEHPDPEGTPEEKPPQEYQGF